jgi:sugar-specific transcriptional regulator TrmB
MESLLKSFGLTEYESRAYVTLLSLGLATAEQLSKRGNIPLPRVYDTLTDLQRKGFVLISKARPKKFSPIQIDKAISNLLSNQKKEFEDKQTHLQEMMPEVKRMVSTIPKSNINESKWDIWTFDRKSNIVRILDEQKIQAKNEVLIFSGDMSWMIEISEIMRKIAKKGVKIKVLVADPRGIPQIEKNISDARKLGMQVKTGYTGLVRGHIIDSKIASINLEFSKHGLNIPGKGMPESEKEKSYEMLTFDNPILISVLKENFESWWNKLK